MAFPASDTAASGSIPPASKNPIAELKNGKVIFRQKPISLEKSSETMQEIVKFREMLDSRVNNQDLPLVSIPEEHRPLIVKLAQESDKGIISLARQIRSILLPGPGEIEDAHRLNLESSLPFLPIEHTIKLLMKRSNYGLDGPLGHKLPAAVCVWRWEVQDSYRDWLPKSARESADARLAERIQACADLRTVFDNLSQAERDAILDPKGVSRLPINNINKSDMSSINDEGLSEDHVSKDASNTMDNGGVLSENFAPKQRKAPDPGKAAKIKDKEEKRAAKVEKEKKQKEAQNRSRSIMANFFGKHKTSIRDSPVKDSNTSSDSVADCEFQRTFKPFVLKKGAKLAPYNWFLEGKRRSRNRMAGVTHEEVIVIDDGGPVHWPELQNAVTPSDEIAPPGVPGDSPTILQVLVKELLQSSLDFCQKMGNVSSFKTYSPRSVRDTISQLNDAEIAGEPTQVRHLLSLLRDRQVFPAKVLIFHEDSRPGYYGTWTRNSREVGPRAPLARDVLAHDYGYDSGEDWEDEGPGDADDVVDDGEDDEPDAEDLDSDLDSWLVDDDDESRPPLDLDDTSPPPFDLTMPSSKRKAESVGKRSEKKRKTVVPLIPYVKGPFWESHVGHCEYDPFNSYRIQLFNDAPQPIDPFTFISVVFEEGQSSQVDPYTTALALPDAVQPSVGTAASSTSKRMMSSVPKTIFPDAHLDTLLAKITDLATPNFTFLVESIYQDLRTHKVKKNAIEAKLREIGEKSKDKKIWVVKQAVQVLD